jgi:hypothetical protein
MYIYIYKYIYINIYMYMYMYIYINIYIYTYTYTSICIYVCFFIHTSVHVSSYMYIQVLFRLRDSRLTTPPPMMHRRAPSSKSLLCSRAEGLREVRGPGPGRARLGRRGPLHPYPEYSRANSYQDPVPSRGASLMPVPRRPLHLIVLFRL